MARRLVSQYFASHAYLKNQIFITIIAATLSALSGCGGSGMVNIPPPLTHQFTTIDVPSADNQVIEGTEPVAFDGHGNIVGTFYTDNHYGHGFIRTASGKFTTFEIPEASPVTIGSITTGVSANGTIIGDFWGNDSGPSAFIRDTDGTIILPDGSGATYPDYSFGINDNGFVVHVIVAEIDPDNTSVIAYLNNLAPRAPVVTTIFTIDPRAGKYVREFHCSINSSNAVACSMKVGVGVWEAFLRTPDGTTTNFQAPDATGAPGTGANVASLNNNNDLVGTSVDPSGASHSYIRTSDGTFTVFDPPATGPNGSQALGINDAGLIIGYYLDANGVQHGYLRDTAGKFTIIDDPQASQLTNTPGTTPRQINSAGAILGTYFDVAGVEHGFLRQ